MDSTKLTLPDGIGSVEILDVFGDDLTVVNAARVSFDKESHEFDGKDEKLVNYLASHGHISPFFHPQIRFRIKMPIFVAREWYRHTIGLARNEVSRRYVDSDPEFWMPQEFRERAPNLKQGSKLTSIAENENMIAVVSSYNEQALAFYKSMLKDGVCPEQARAVLPQSMYTEFIETGSLAAYARICKLRTDSHAQLEIQEYANAVSILIKNHTNLKVSWNALFPENNTPLQ